ncbi:hypothetical protein [Actinomadura fibrosa]|uniref:Large adhesin n=1 Tax=Actinomadura fibrosa TaxID=111802 RepID=A0ABW2XSB8_9ACTN|nr:hypothetical protein [Actinomadura fibrosa]
MTSYIVVFGLIVVVVLVVVLVALGLRASRAGRDDDDWMADEQAPQPRGRRAAPPPQPEGAPADGYDTGYEGDYDTGYDDASYGPGAPDPAYDRRVAGGPLAAPTAAPPSAPPPPAPAGQASDEMEDDDYWATITFDKPKFPWQHDQGGDRQQPDPAADPLHAQAQPGPEQPAEPPNLTQPVSLGQDGSILNGMGAPTGTGPQQMPQGPGGFQGGAPFGDPGSTAHDPIPADLAMPGGTGPQAPFGVPGQPDQPVYGGQEPQHAYGAAEQPPYGGQEPSYGGAEQSPYGDQPPFGVPGDQPSYGGQEPAYGGGQDQPPYGDQSPFGVPDQPQYGSPEPSYGDYNSDPLGGRPAAAAGPPPSGGSGGFPTPQGASDPLGLPLGRPDEPMRGYGDSTGLPGTSDPLAPPATPPAPPAPAAPPATVGGLGGGSGSDTDNHKLPTVDELLQRIQTDRQRSAGGSSQESGGSFGGPLNDPLNDPLGSGSFGGGAGTGNTGPWPQGGTSGAPASGGPASGYDSGAGYDGGLGSGTPGYGQSGSQGDGYPTSPAYGDAPRYDDPLNTGGGRGSFGSFGTGSDGGQGGPGGYGDFSGSSYNGGSDPLAAPHDPNAGGQGGGFADPNSTQAYNPGYFGSQQDDYQQNNQQSGDTGPYGSRQQPDDWQSHRDYRR